jgi:hypothetical protein
MTQWIEHLRSTTDYAVPPELNRVLDLTPRLKIIAKNLNNTDLVNRIANAPEPPVQTIEDDQVCLIHRSRITLTISFLQVSLGPDDILFDDEGEPAHKSVPVEQDVTMTDISSAVSDFLFVKPY